jgi:hypothetical protein
LDKDIIKEDYTETDENVVDNKMLIDNHIKNITISIGKSLQSMEIISKHMQTIVQQSLEPMRIISNIVSEFNNSIKKIIDNIPKIPPKVLKRLMVVGSLIEHDWWYLKEISWDIWDYMFNSELTREDIDTTIIKTFNNNNYELLDRMIISLKSNSQYKMRKHIIDSSVWAYKQGRHELVIPTIITLYEGVMYEFYSKTELYKEIDNRRKQFALGNIVGKTIETLEDVLDLIDSSFLISLEKFFESGDFDSLPDFNRHKILHGRTINYYTEVNSLKSIVLLVYIMENIFKISNEESLLEM